MNHVMQHIKSISVDKGMQRECQKNAPNWEGIKAITPKCVLNQIVINHVMQHIEVLLTLLKLILCRSKHYLTL